MGYDIMGADDILGADELLGAARRRQAMRGGIRPQPSLLNRVPGVSGPALAKLPLGFPTASFHAVTSGTGFAWAPGSSTVAGTSAQVQTRPQVPVVPKRLVVNFVSNIAAVMVKITNVRVGTKSILASADGIDASTFSPGAFGVELTAESAQPGIDITIDYTLLGAAPTGTNDFVHINATFIADSII